jgi:hypothetical protein
MVTGSMINSLFLKILVSLDLLALCLLTREVWRLRRFNRFMAQTKPLDYKLPLGTKFYWDAKTARACKRCKQGGIWRRNRFKIIEKEGGGTRAKELSAIYGCDNCSYRGLSPK